MIPDSKRRFLYNKRVAPNTFVFFFHKGPSETSWSVRDYSMPGSIGLRYASDFRDGAGRIPWASEIRASSEYDFAAPAHPTTDLDHWHSAIRAKNSEYLAHQDPALPPPVFAAPTMTSCDAPNIPAFPILNLPKLLASPKAKKRGDIERILHSQNSEDYVTWNFFQLLAGVPASAWWPRLLELAVVDSLDPADFPVVRLWQTTAAPRAYEALSRERMRAGENQGWRERSLDMNPVEGPSEIDITFEGKSYIIFVEAKLGSDVSLSTTYDPERNQIARNVDCVLDICGNRWPAFWMFVRDRAATRAYVQLMARYRSVSELHRALPHRAAARLEEVVSGLAVITWADLLKLLAPTPRVAIEAEVEREIQRRVTRANLPAADPATGGIEPDDGRHRFGEHSEAGEKK
jgi:hypothetical protein